MWNNVPYIFNTKTPYIVKEGLSFWVNNSYRNYHSGIATVPVFLDEYMPQQTHFDALFHILFYKKLVVESYLVDFKITLDAIVDNVNRITKPTTNTILNFSADLEQGLEAFREWYISTEDYSSTFFDDDIDYANVRKALQLCHSVETKKKLHKKQWSVSRALDELSVVFFSTADASDSTTIYNQLIQDKSRGTPICYPSFMQNLFSVSGNKHQGNIKKVASVTIGDVTKTIYHGFPLRGSLNISLPRDKAYKCILEIPIDSYKLTLKNKDNGKVASALIDGVIPICTSTGYFTIKNRWAEQSHIGTMHYDLGHLPLKNNQIEYKSVGTKRAVFIDNATSKLLGGDETVTQAEIEKVQYLYNQDIFGTKNRGQRKHVHGKSISITKGYFKGTFTTSNPYVSRSGKSTYVYGNTWAFDSTNFRYDKGTSYIGEYVATMEGVNAGRSISRGHSKDHSYYYQLQPSLPSGTSAMHLTKYQKTKFSSDKMFRAKLGSIRVSTGYNTEPTSHNDYIENIEINLTVYDPVASICKALLDGVIEAPTLPTPQPAQQSQPTPQPTQLPTQPSRQMTTVDDF